MKTLKTEPFNKFDKQWAVVSAGSKDDYNMMTISWGSMGTLWNKPIVTIYIKPIRYTYDYLVNNDYFTVSFFDEEYRDDLMMLGSLSGRDGDKLASTRLTPVATDKGITYKEATTTIVCKKIYYNDLVVENMPKDVVRANYSSEAPHRMFIGEVVDIIED